MGQSYCGKSKKQIKETIKTINMLRIEITKEQFDAINDEITKLENDKLKLFDTDGLTGWEMIYIGDRINQLKEIIRTEHIEL